jgi:hypothetical protein
MIIFINKKFIRNIFKTKKNPLVHHNSFQIIRRPYVEEIQSCYLFCHCRRNEGFRFNRLF